VVMPGHGDLMKPADVAEFASLISGFYKIVLDLYKSGRQEWDVRKTMDLEPWRRMSRFDALMGPSINKVWLEVEADNF